MVRQSVKIVFDSVLVGFTFTELFISFTALASIAAALITAATWIFSKLVLTFTQVELYLGSEFFDLVSYTLNFGFLLGFFVVYYSVIVGFIILYISLKLLKIASSIFPVFHQILTSTLLRGD